MQLGKEEEQIMHILWTLRKATIKEILNHYSELTQSYNEVLTIVRILELKDLVYQRIHNRAFVYYPNVQKKEYSH